MLTRKNSEKVEAVAIPSENYLFGCFTTVRSLAEGWEKKKREKNVILVGLINRKTEGKAYFIGTFCFS